MNDYDFDDNEFPLAYLITIRCHGTWLHGDERRAVDRHGFNAYGAPRRAPNEKLEHLMRDNMKQAAILLDDRQREVVKEAISEVCARRTYDLKAINVRTNHAHAVVSAQSKPEPIINAFKSYSTRKLRETGLLGNNVRPWARGKSRRYLWKPRSVSRAIDYVLYGQGDIVPDFDNQEFLHPPSRSGFCRQPRSTTIRPATAYPLSGAPDGWPLPKASDRPSASPFASFHSRSSAARHRAGDSLRALRQKRK